MRLSLEREFPPIWDRAQRFVFKQLVRSLVPYQPVVLGNETLAAGERRCSDRWLAVAEVMRATQSASFLDLGCAEGYFVQQAAATFRCVAVGVDADIRRLTVARMAATLNRVEGVGFIESVIDDELISKLPVFDVVLFLSVLHHIMYEHGLERARQMLSAIRRLTGKRLIFDMGQSNEISHEWSKLLPVMEPDAATWISQFLKSAGFSAVEVAGSSDAYRSGERRLLFIASP